MSFTRRSVDDLWDAFECGDVHARDELIVHFMPLVRRVAERMCAGLPGMVDVQDLASEGSFGLIDAVEKFDRGRGVKFETYAQWRVQGAIRDYLRRQDWLSRGVRDRLKAVERAVVALEQDLGGVPSDEQISAWLVERDPAGGWTAVVVREVLGHYVTGWVGSLEDMVVGAGAGLMDSGMGLEDLVGEGVLGGLLKDLIRALGERERVAICLYFFEEFTLAEVGRVLGVSESRVSQLLKKISLGLHGHLTVSFSA